MCCGERSPEGGCPAAVRLSASCSVTRVTQRERLLKQTWPERALGARVRDAPGFSPTPRPLRTGGQRPRASTACAQLAASRSQSQPVTGGPLRPRRDLGSGSLDVQQTVGCCGVAALSSSSRWDGQASPAIASVTADHWRWRAKRPAVVLNLHPDAACGCSRSRLVAGASRIRHGALSPPTRLADVLNLNLPLPPRLS